MLLRGFFAREISANNTITQAQLCPQGYFCPGGVPNSTFNPSSPLPISPDGTSIVRCSWGMWTREVGSVAAEQCCESRPVWEPALQQLHHKLVGQTSNHCVMGGAAFDTIHDILYRHGSLAGNIGAHVTAAAQYYKIACQLLLCLLLACILCFASVVCGALVQNQHTAWAFRYPTDQFWLFPTVTPPGFFTANGTTQPCPEGSFRAKWQNSSGKCGCHVFRKAEPRTLSIVWIDPAACSSTPCVLSNYNLRWALDV